MLALTEPPSAFETLAEPGFGRSPNPGENLATMFLRNRSDIKAKNPLCSKLCQDWPKHAALGAPFPFGYPKAANWPQDLTEFAKT